MAERKLLVVVSAKVNEFRQGMNTVVNQMNRVTNQAKRGIGPAMEQVGKALKVASAAGVAGFSAFVVSGVRANAAMEQYRSTLNTVMGDSRKAAETLDWVKQYAARTPFEIPELVESTTKLTAMGLEAKKFIPIAADMAAVFASSGKSVNDAAEAINDAMMGEFERLKEFGIKLGKLDFAAGGKYAGKTYAEAVMAEVQNRNYTGAADALASTFTGRLATLRDTIGQIMQTATAPIFDRLSESMGGLMKRIDELQQSGQLKEWTDRITESMTRLFDIAVQVGEYMFKIATVIANNWGLISPILAGVLAAFMAYKTAITVTTALTVAQKALNLVMSMNPFGLVVTAIGLLVAAGVALYQNWDLIKEKATALWEWIKSVWDRIKAATVNTWNNIKTYLSTAWGNLKTWASDIFSGMVDTIVGYWQNLWDRITGFVDRIKNAIMDISPFTRHSPSLVEQVEAGVERIRGAYQGLQVDMGRMQLSVPGGGAAATNNNYGGNTITINVTGGWSEIERELHRRGVRI